jgi:hypothetical protein
LRALERGEVEEVERAFLAGKSISGARGALGF